MRTETDFVSVFVLEGEVRITAWGGTEGRALTRGERLAYDTAGRFSATDKLDIDAAAAWREGRLVFKSRPLGEVIAELRRYHRATVMVNTLGLNAIKVSGVFRTDDLKLALSTIAATLPIKLNEVTSQLYLLDAVKTTRR